MKKATEINMVTEVTITSIETICPNCEETISLLHKKIFKYDGDIEQELVCPFCNEAFCLDIDSFEEAIIKADSSWEVA